MEPSLPRPSYNNPKTLHIRLKIDLRATNDKTSARLYQLVPKTNLRGCTNWVPNIGKTDLTFEMLRSLGSIPQYLTSLSINKMYM